VTCTFCSAAAALVPTDEYQTCWTCARRIARLARHADHPVPLEIWDAPSLARDENMEELAARVAEAIAPSDSQSHYYLAVAYREMGMHADALREAALALEQTDDVMKATGALRLILTEPLIRTSGREALRERLIRMAKN
jgi:hypothetical protein